MVAVEIDGDGAVAGQVSKTAVADKLRILPSSADGRIGIIHNGIIRSSGELKNLYGGDDLITIIAQIDGIAGIAENRGAAWLVGINALGFKTPANVQMPDEVL